MNPQMYYQTKLLSELFLDKTAADGTSFRAATTMDQFWKFSEEVLIDNLYWDHWYNTNKTATETSILYENYLITSPHLRQLRVRNDSCEVHKDFRKAIHTCYNAYAEYLEERDELANSTGFQWEEIQSFAKNAIWGKISTYSGDGGYIVDLGLNKTAAKEILADLKKNLWINRGTRVVFIDFTTYNPNINLFVVSKLIAEFPATGGMLTSWQFRTLSLLQTGNKAIIATVIFSIFIGFIVYYTIEELVEMKTLGFINYINESFWNFLDILTIVLGSLLIFYSFYKKFVINKIFNQASLEEPTGLQNSSSVALKMETYQFDTLGFWSMQFVNMLALLTFIVWVKVFKYISFNKTMSQLSSTLSRCSKDIAGFGVMFFIVFFAFAQLGYLLFGTQVKDYSSFGTAVFTLLRLILGDFNFQELEAANRVLGPFFFLSYIFFVFFVLMNMFLAIINDTYAEVKSELHEDDEFPIMEYFKSHYQGLLSKLGAQRDQIETIQAALTVESNKKLSFEHVRAELKKRDLSDPEIEMLFAKYDLDSNRELDSEELAKMLADLEGKKLALDAQIEHEQQNRPASAVSRHQFAVGGEDMIKLTRRVDRMEHTLMAISGKIDAALSGKLIIPKAPPEVGVTQASDDENEGEKRWAN
ncbi:polycystic kidney disease 2-like 1 protein isoform X2 [Tetranychus urticae]|nr:polycystic kidney disease 2-like 1 protein isoform X2 [Tetranychus urticae]